MIEGFDAMILTILCMLFFPFYRSDNEEIVL